MSLLDTVTSEIGTAMKQKDQASLGPLRMLKAALMNKEVEKVRALDEAESLQVVGALVKQRRDVRLIICGTGPLKEALESQARDAGVADRVTFTGLVSNAEVARFAAVADVFALPSLLEALPTVAVEALASGTPVVSADHPGGLELHDIFGDDVQVVPKTNVDGLTDALARAVDRPRRVTAATLGLVTKQFGRDEVWRRYEEQYALSQKSEVKSQK